MYLYSDRLLVGHRWGIESKISVQESKPLAVLFRHPLSVNVENHLAIRMRWLACKCMTGVIPSLLHHPHIRLFKHLLYNPADLLLFVFAGIRIDRG